MGAENQAKEPGFFRRTFFRARETDSDEHVRAFEYTWLQRIVAKLPGGRVSGIHLQEARERYISLSREVGNYVQRYNCNGEQGRPEGGGPHDGAAGDVEAGEKCVHLKACRATLDEIWRSYLERKEEKLNYAWRELTRVRIMLVERILPPEKLVQQVDFCREEANRLAVSSDTEVSDMLQRLAEALDESGQSVDSTQRTRRLVRALLERFNTIRTNRIHHQYLTIRTYKYALAVLLVLSVVLIRNEDQLVDNTKSVDSTVVAVETGFCAPLFAGVDSGEENTGTLGKLYCFGVVFPMHRLEVLLAGNVLAFVYFAGLIGGFFSIATRARSADYVPGEDAYILWYVLTKPLVGASGAIILFVLFQGGLVELNLLNDLGAEPSPEVFGFAFLAGFSERIVFPSFR